MTSVFEKCDELNWLNIWKELIDSPWPKYLAAANQMAVPVY
jgi:hypothetical protein